MDLKEAKQIVFDGAQEGVDCPCCGMYVKEWKKTIISVAAASLIKLVQLFEKEEKFYHLSEFNVLESDRNFSQLVLWDLVEAMSNDNPHKRASGMYQPTKIGVLFAKGDVDVKKYVHTLNNRLLKSSGDRIDIVDALGKKFDYAKLVEDNY